MEKGIVFFATEEAKERAKNSQNLNIPKPKRKNSCPQCELDLMRKNVEKNKNTNSDKE